MIQYPEEANVSLVAEEPRGRQFSVTISKKPAPEAPLCICREGLLGG